MSQNKHTPGPWRILPEEVEKPYIRIRATQLGTRFKIANVTTPVYNDVHPREVIETRANAHLIAAAPDLLEALENLMGAYSEPDDRLCCSGTDCGCMGATRYQQAEHYARAAIAKARGEQP